VCIIGDGWMDAYACKERNNCLLYELNNNNNNNNKNNNKTTNDARVNE